MEEDEAVRLFEEALKCRKLAWSLSDERSQLILHEIAAAYESSAHEQIEARRPAMPWPLKKAASKRRGQKSASNRLPAAPSKIG